MVMYAGLLKKVYIIENLVYGILDVKNFKYFKNQFQVKKNQIGIIR